MLYFDWTILLLIPAVLLSLFAQWKVGSTFNRYARVETRQHMTGGDVARTLARRLNLPVSVEPHQGFLSDHYDPRSKKLALSPDVYTGRSISSFGVAAHEFGHALQDRDNYFPLRLRSGLVPVATFGSQFSWLLFFGGLLAGIRPLLYAGIGLFALAVLFTLITLPVEFDASNRAMRLLESEGLVTGQEAAGVKKVLNAAALTYVAAAVMAVLQLLRLILIANSRE